MGRSSWPGTSKTVNHNATEAFNENYLPSRNQRTDQKVQSPTISLPTPLSCRPPGRLERLNTGTHVLIYHEGKSIDNKGTLFLVLSRTLPSPLVVPATGRHIPVNKPDRTKSVKVRFSERLKRLMDLTDVNIKIAHEIYTYYKTARRGPRHISRLDSPTSCIDRQRERNRMRCAENVD